MSMGCGENWDPASLEPELMEEESCPRLFQNDKATTKAEAKALPAVVITSKKGGKSQLQSMSRNKGGCLRTLSQVGWWQENATN